MTSTPLLPSLPLQHNFDLSQHNTMGLNSIAKYYVAMFNDDTFVAEIQTLQNTIKSDAKLNQLPWRILAGGSNLILPPHLEALVIHIQTKGMQIICENDQSCTLRVAAGENWHEFVLKSLDMGLAGLENLALIPGSVGASPVQNIGAYGREVADFITAVECYDLLTQQHEIIAANDCGFAYRDSHFKQQWCGQKIIQAVHFRLNKLPYHQTNIRYGAIQQTLKASGLDPQNPKHIAKAVIQIRQSKLPDPKTICNTGSFFKNPIVPAHLVQKLLESHPSMPHYDVPAPASNAYAPEPPQAGTSPMSETSVRPETSADLALKKLAAGWLIEQTGLKGFTLGKVGTYAKQALVVVNHQPQNATQDDIQKLTQHIQQQVLEKFNVALEAEPVHW